MYNAQFNPYAQNVAIVRDYFKRTPVLLAAIFQFLGTALTVAYTLFFSAWSVYFTQDLMSQLSNELSKSGFSASDLGVMLQSSFYSSLLSMIPSAILGVLVAVGYLLLFLKSRSKNPDSNPRPGATILFVLALIEMIGAIIASVMFVIFFIIMTVAIQIGANYNGYNSSASFAAGSVTLIVGITIVISVFLMLFYSINKMRYFKSIKNSCASINLYANGAGAYGVMNIISAILAFLSAGSVALMIPLISMADSLMYQNYGSSLTDYINADSLSTLILFTIAVIVVAIVSLIFEAIVALGYKKYINNIKYSYQPANIPEAPYQPAVQPQYTAPTYPQQPVQQSFEQPDEQIAPQPAESVQPAEPEQSAIPERPAPSAETTSSALSYCPACGTPVGKDVTFCTRCGFKVK